MVESIWWKDGPINRITYHDDECSEGWIVLASMNAYEIIRRTLQSIVRLKAVVRKCKKEENKELLRFTVIKTPL